MDDPTLLKRLQAIEEQLDILSRQAGVPYSRPGFGLPSNVRNLALAGKTIDAIKEYRALTGASLMEAKEAVERG